MFSENNRVDKHPKTKNLFVQLKDKDKRRVMEQYSRISSITNQNLQDIKIKDKYTKKQFIKAILTPDEDIVNIEPLYLDRYSIKSAETRDLIDDGIGAEALITTKRLILVDTSINEEPGLMEHYSDKKDEKKRIEVSHEIRDSFNFSGFHLNDIYGTSMKMENRVSTFVNIIKMKLLWLIASGLLAISTSLLLLFNNMVGGPFDFLTNRDLFYLLLLGIILLFVGLFYDYAKLKDPYPIIIENKIIELVTLDPKYKQRCSLELHVNTAQQDLPETLYWMKNLQNHCEAIAKPKSFDTIMEV